MLKSSIGAALALGALLTGCGGGGDGGSSSNVPGSSDSTVSTVLRAEGVYTGTLSNGEKHETIILENGQIFMMHGDFKSLNGQAVIEGSSKADNESYSSADARDFDSSSAVPFFPASISASYNSAGSFSGTISEQGQTSSFSSVRPAISLYDYNQPASLDKVAGSWGDFLLKVTVSTAGDIQLSSRQCDGKGTIKPRATGKNVFDIEWTFGAIPACPFYGQTVKSIAFVQGYTQAGSTVSQKLFIMGVDNARAKGQSWYLVR